MKTVRSSRGEEGERLAKEFLLGHGLTIIDTNYRYGHGEIDIIARDEETLVFCEVKLRFSDEYGEPEYAVTAKKQSQIRQVARGYLYEHSIADQACRFDVIAIRMNGPVPEIRYLPDAF